MRTRMLAFLLGTVLVALWPALPGWEALAAAAVVCLLTARLCEAGLPRGAGAASGPADDRHSSRCAAFAALLTGNSARERRGTARRLALGCAVLGWLLVGMGWHVAVAQRQLELRLSPALEGQDLLVRGYVASLPESGDGLWRFRFFVESGPAGFSGRQIQLNLYRNPFTGPQSAAEQPLRAGQVWQLKVRLQRPHGFANPGTFDYEGWLLQQRIAARGYVRDSVDNRYLGQDRLTLNRLRDSLRVRLREVTAQRSHQALFLALSLGDRGGLSAAQEDLFNRTGTSHLVVISGLHVTLVALLCGWLAGWLWRRSGAALNRLPVPQARALAALTCALVYSLLAGFGLPARRALVMLAVFLILRLLGLHGSPLVALLIAAVAVLLLDPLAVIGAGFWLSFGAVAALLLAFSGVPSAGQRSAGQLMSHLVTPQLVVLVGLLAPLGFWLGQISLLAPLANLVAIPLVSWGIVPLCLLGSLLCPIWPAAAGLLFGLADPLAMLLVGWLQGVGGITVSASVPVAAGTVLAVAGLLLGSLLLLLPGPRQYRLLGCLLIAPLVWPARSAPARLAIHVLDVGQGLAVLVQTPGHALVYDTGPRYRSGFDSGTALLAPVARRLGVHYVDRLVVSHGDNDHAGGAAGLLAALPVAGVLTGDPVPGLPDDAGYCERGQAWRWERVQFRILHPPPGANRPGNNGSCVLEIQAEGFRALLPGDVDAAVERQLLTKAPGLAPLDLLVSAHHGSATSTSWAFLSATRPALVIHSAGYRNQFGHPARRIRERIDNFGARQLLTAEQGMISLAYHGPDQPVKVTTRRTEYRRYWHW